MGLSRNPLICLLIEPTMVQKHHTFNHLSLTMSLDQHDEDEIWGWGFFISVIMLITYFTLELDYEIELSSSLTTNIPDSGWAFYSSCCFSILVWVVPGQILARIFFSYPLASLSIVPIVIYLFAGTDGCFAVLLAIPVFFILGACFLFLFDDEKSGDAALLMVLASGNGGESLTNNIPICSMCGVRPVEARVSGIRYRHGDICMWCGDDEC